jgi:D-lactate dehydrogenase
MKVAVFSAKRFERRILEDANREQSHELVFFEMVLDEQTTSLAVGFPAVSASINDNLNRTVLAELSKHETRVVLMRSAGFNNVDIDAAEECGLTVLRVPAYPPHAVAEHTVGLIISLSRKLHRAFSRVREENFSLEGLMGFDLHRRTVGIVGTGKIGTLVARIMDGFGCRVLAHDPVVNPACLELGAQYVTLPQLARESDIITLHCPLTPDTYYLIDGAFLKLLKPGAALINTSRGALLDPGAIIHALKTGRLGHLGIDVYEEEADHFFRYLSPAILQDDVIARLLTFPNVVITAHQGFFTREAVTGIAVTTIQNITDFAHGTVGDQNRLGTKHFQ